MSFKGYNAKDPIQEAYMNMGQEEQIDETAGDNAHEEMKINKKASNVKDHLNKIAQEKLKFDVKAGRLYATGSKEGVERLKQAYNSKKDAGTGTDANGKHFFRMSLHEEEQFDENDQIEETEASSYNSLKSKLEDVVSGIKRVDPSNPAYKKLRKYIAGLDDNVLKKLRDEKIKWISTLAGTELIIRNRKS